MPDYLPLCASRQDLLPPACRSCAWWQTSSGGRDRAVAVEKRRHQWMVAVESSWGSPGLLLQRAGQGVPSGESSSEKLAGAHDQTTPSPDLAAAASIHYAPATALPRLRNLPFAPLCPDAVLLFCLRSEEDRADLQAKRVIQKALGQLKDRGVQEVYAFAGHFGSPEDNERCEFFSLDFLEANGFRHVRDNGDIYLMRADLRGLLSLISQVETAVRRALRNDPTPSPAAWTHRGTS